MQSAEVPLVSTAEPVWRGRTKRALWVALAASPFVAAIGFQLPVCPSASFLGVPCPGCGLTRATLAALQGHIGEAFHFHPLVFLLTPLYVGFMITAAWTYVRGPEPNKRPNPHLGKIVGVVMSVAMVLMIGVWVARFFGMLGGPVPVDPIRAF